MSRWSATDRGAVEPLAALAGVLVVGLLLSTYAVGVERTLPTERDRDLATSTLAAADDRVTRNGLARPDRLDAEGLAPSGYRVRVVLRAAGSKWADGDDPPADAATATRQVSVRVGPGRVRPGRLRVEVWPRE